MGRLPRSGRCEVATTASPEAVWTVVGDPTRVGEWSHECGSAEWIDGATAARPGARFRGRNRVGKSRWTRVNEVVRASAPHELAWRTVPAWCYPDSTIWTITVAPEADSNRTRITERYEVVKLSAIADRLIWQFVPVHRDRTDALAGDLQRIGDVARGQKAETTD